MSNKALATALAAVLAVFAMGSLRGQTEAAKPAGIKIEQGAPAKPDAAKPLAAKPMKTAAATGKRPVHMFDDARHCLDQGAIAEIVKCAEPYRY
jgi:hypothetical protein